ncbi:hypothetical protein OIU84_029839 [Salix udensis]|uniref:Uncharacterized protein n=1 Tax=Salix udensis TaxID=889485 RepID=A0AAD6KA64_9ROSI|nr:hypothetical protein OIU84_029839 [Salix udensis]
MMKLSFALSLLLSVALLSSLLRLTMALPNDVASPPPPSPAIPSFCDPKCKVRCSKSGRYQRCYHFCIICCKACKCVPSGPYANKSECPCYRDKLNSKGTSKCP